VGGLAFQALSFVKMSISSYEEPDWPGYRDLVVCDGDQEDNYFPRVTGTKLFGQNSFAFAKQPKWNN